MDKRTEQQAREIRELQQLEDEDIDTSDIPEILDWTGAVVGRFYRCGKDEEGEKKD